MTSKADTIKQVTTRWPESFWKKVAIRAIDRGVTINSLVIRAVANDVGIDVPDQEEETLPPAA